MKIRVDWSSSSSFSGSRRRKRRLGKRKSSEGPKIWGSKAWKNRRRQVISRTDRCEWCRKKFAPPKQPKVVQHLKKYKGDDWKAKYLSMKESEVAVICKGCHVTVTRFRVRRGSVRSTCPECGHFKRPKYDTCYRCHIGSK